MKPIPIIVNELHNVWLDKQARIIFSRIIAIPHDIRTFETNCESFITSVACALKIHKQVNYSICDVSAMTSIPIEFMNVYFQKCLPQQFNKGIAAKAIVKPKYVCAESLKINIESKLLLPVPQLFNTFEDALKSIIKMQYPQAIYSIPLNQKQNN
jgi:hypothetical protein